MVDALEFYNGESRKLSGKLVSFGHAGSNPVLCALYFK